VVCGRPIFPESGTVGQYALPGGFFSCLFSAVVQGCSPMKTALMAGATGLVGGYLLRFLLDAP
jgi:hypothetical protein